MILAVVGYLMAFGLAGGPIATRGFPWTMFLFALPTLWISGVIIGLPTALTLAMYGIVALALWATVSGAVLPGLGAIVLAFVGWDAASLVLWLRRTQNVGDRTAIWQRLLLRSLGAGLAGAGLAIVFAQFELSLPFWVLVGLLMAAWGVLFALRRAATRRVRLDVSPEVFPARHTPHSNSSL